MVSMLYRALSMHCLGLALSCTLEACTVCCRRTLSPGTAHQVGDISPWSADGKGEARGLQVTHPRLQSYLEVL